MDFGKVTAFSGPITIEEMKFVAQRLREKRTRGELQSYLSTAKKQPEVVSSSSASSTASQNIEAKTDEAQTVKSDVSAFVQPDITEPTAADIVCEEEHIFADEVAQEVLEETEQVVIQEFSLEEAHFSGCNLSGLNLSFPDSDPVKDSDEVASKETTDKTTEVHSDLYTLACISDLAEKINVVNIKEAESVTAVTPTPQTKKNSLSHLYSPISPADLSSQYLDAEDASLKEEKKADMLPNDVIDAIISLQSNRYHDKVQDNIEESVEYTSAIIQPEEKPVSITRESPVTQEVSQHEDEKFSSLATPEVLVTERALLQDSCSGEKIGDMSASSLVSSGSANSKRDNLSLLNDTMDEMDMILSMGVGYLQTTSATNSYVEQPQSTEKKESNVPISPVTLQETDTYSTDTFSSGIKNRCVFAKLETSKPVHVATPIPSAGKAIYGSTHLITGKKLFQTPKEFKTPKNANPTFEQKSSLVGSAPASSDSTKEYSAGHFKVPKVGSTTNIKPITSKIPKFARPLNKVPITSPVSQYIRGPVMAPRVAVVHSKSPHSAPKTNTKFAASKLVSPKHYCKKNNENSSPNLPSVKLPYVDYDTASSIKVVEHLESKQKPLPNKIKKLMPLPGAVFRHTGRVNIPESVDGRQEVSILVSHDAIH